MLCPARIVARHYRPGEYKGLRDESVLGAAFEYSCGGRWVPRGSIVNTNGSEPIQSSEKRIAAGAGSASLAAISSMVHRSLASLRRRDL